MVIREVLVTTHGLSSSDLIIFFSPQKIRTRM